MRGKTHAIFDLDGTLVDSLPGIHWSIQNALRACDLPCTDADLRWLIGPPVRSILATASCLSDPHSLDRLEEAFRSAYDTTGWRMTKCYAGARDLLADLKRVGVAIWLITNKPASATRNILRSLELDPFFNEVVCRDCRTPAYDSKAEALMDLIVRHGLPQSECVLIGDTREDRISAAEAGIESIIVAHGYGSSITAEEPDWLAVREQFDLSTQLTGAVLK